MTEEILASYNKFDDLEQRVIGWANNRGLIDGTDAKSQCLKTLSEAGELADAVLKGNRSDAIDAIGDVVVTLILLSEKLETSVPDCLAHAYSTIKDRKGKMHNGTFIKQEDLAA